jgi:hypothetical protein
MKTKHTPGTWSIDPDDDQSIIVGRRGVNAARVALTRYSGVPGAEDKANAERIVACVNALKGIEDPEAFVKAARRVLGEMAYLRATNDIRDSVNNYSDAELEADGRAMGVPNLFDADGVE